MDKVTVTVRVAPVDCWSCGAEFRIVTLVEIATGKTSVECRVSDFTAYPRLISPIESNLPNDAHVGKIKSRASQAMGHSYISNGCYHCDALYGQHYEIHARYDEVVAVVFEGMPLEEWTAMSQALAESEDGHLI